jgi:hypothetical protein
LSVTCDSSVVFSGTPVSSTNETDRHDITEILLKVALISIGLTVTLFFNQFRQFWYILNEIKIIYDGKAVKIYQKIKLAVLFDKKAKLAKW